MTLGALASLFLARPSAADACSAPTEPFQAAIRSGDSIYFATIAAATPDTFWWDTHFTVQQVSRGSGFAHLVKVQSANACDGLRSGQTGVVVTHIPDRGDVFFPFGGTFTHVAARSALAGARISMPDTGTSSPSPAAPATTPLAALASLASALVALAFLMGKRSHTRSR